MGDTSRPRRPARLAPALAVAGLLIPLGCATEHDSGALPAPTSPSAPTATPTTTSTTSTTTSTTSTTTTSTTTPSTTTPSTTTPSTTTTVPPDPIAYDVTVAAFASLAHGNAAASLSVWRDGEPVLQLGSGTDLSGEPVTATTPMVVASVSKLITALTVVRLDAADVLDVSAPVPWHAVGFAPDPGWLDVTPRELLDHTSGMPVARNRWLDDPGSCAIPLADLLASPPTRERGRWRYSNGNYCALGLLIEAVTETEYGAVGQWLVFGPVGAEGPHLTTEGLRPGDAPHRADVVRFDRLGAAGSWVAGTDHIAAVLAAVTDEDLHTLRWPGIVVDQYGWGHTGSLRGATSCAWVLEGGRTVMVATVAGDRPSAGGGICDLVLPALAHDLGLFGPGGSPDRSPRQG